MPSDMFGPLSGDAVQAAPVVPVPADDAGDSEVVMPVPAHVPDPQSLPKYRDTVRWFAYRDRNARLLGYMRRIRKGDGGKLILPLTYVKAPDGTCDWRLKGFPVPRPLYGLPRLGDSDAKPALIVEGEKAADAAQGLFPDFAVLTSPHGSNGAGKADWTPLRGRDVTIWPDNDDAGRAYARTVAAAGRLAGARRVRIVAVPAGFPASWDLADAPPPGIAANDIARMIDEAPPAPLSLHVESEGTQGNSSFRVTATHIEYRAKNDADEPEWHAICDRFDVLAFTRSENGEDWGRLLAVTDPDGQVHYWPMPMSLLGGDAREVRERLLSLGLRLGQGRGNAQRLTDYIMQCTPKRRVRSVARIGWHGERFVLPDESFGPQDEPVFLQTAEPARPPFRIKGGLAAWRDNLAALAVGNSRLAFALALAFAPPLLHLLGHEGGGFHLRGASSTGKTTAMRMAASVWGGPPEGGYVRTWRSTDNALEATAVAFCDALLCLDELGQLDARAAGAAAYMLANGEGKARSRKDGAARPVARWRTLFLSTGEISLADLANEGGKRINAGQEVRFVDIPAETGSGMGLFQSLHGSPSPQAFARRISEAAGRHYGQAARAFLAQLAHAPEAAVERARAVMAAFVGRHVPPGAEGQVYRVGQRFALVAAAGELARDMGLLSWPEGEAERAAQACFHAWIEARGGIGAVEDMRAIEAVRGFLARYGDSRFPKGDELASDRPAPARAGFRRTEGGELYFLFFPAVFRAEVCAGLDPIQAARSLDRAGYLLRGRRELQHQARIPAMQGLAMRFYWVRASILAGGPPAES